MKPVRQIAIAGALREQYLSDNTRAVPLVRKDDAHQGRVFCFSVTVDDKRWIDEVERRYDDWKTGRTTAVPAEHAIAEMRGKLRR
jgi:hypothetical protein